MSPADRDAPDGPPVGGGGWTTAGVVLLVLAAVAQVVSGVAAIAGVDALKDNVREIESNPQFGKLYLSLGAWGVLLLLVAGAELLAALSLVRRTPNARLLCLGITLPGLAVSFFTLALLRVASAVMLALLFAALYVFSYRVDS
jgi:hypothetical protein